METSNVGAVVATVLIIAAGSNVGAAAYPGRAYQPDGPADHNALITYFADF